MKHIAIVTSGLVGITNATIELAHRLISEGYKITFLSPMDVKEKVIKYGFDYVQLPEINFNFSIKKHLIPDTKKKSWISAYFYYRANSKKILKDGVSKLNLYKYEDILKMLNPDLALVDMEIHEAILAAVKLNIKTKLLSQFFIDQKQSNLPSLVSNIIPGKGIKGTLIGIEFSWFRIKLRTLIGSIAHRLLMRDNRKSILLYYRKINNLNKLEIANRMFPSDFIYLNMETFYLVMSELEFPFKQPKNAHHLGAMINLRRKDSNDLRVFKKIVNEKKDENKKLLYCSITTMKNIGDLNFIKKLIEAVTRRNDWILIVSLGRSIGEEQYFQNLPKNIHVFSWVPQLYMLKNCDCSINHGGIHTINECLYFKVPMLIYSGKKYDQDGNLARLIYHNLALMGNKDKDDVYTIQQKINTILTNNTIIENLKNLESIFKKYKTEPITPYL